MADLLSGPLSGIFSDHPGIFPDSGEEAMPATSRADVEATVSEVDWSSQQEETEHG